MKLDLTAAGGHVSNHKQTTTAKTKQNEKVKVRSVSTPRCLDGNILRPGHAQLAPFGALMTGAQSRAWRSFEARLRPTVSEQHRPPDSMFIGPALIKAKHCCASLESFTNAWQRRRNRKKKMSVKEWMISIFLRFTFLHSNKYDFVLRKFSAFNCLTADDTEEEATNSSLKSALIKP